MKIKEDWGSKTTFKVAYSERSIAASRPSSRETTDSGVHTGAGPKLL
jgi:hypothetical protein